MNYEYGSSRYVCAYIQSFFYGNKCIDKDLNMIKDEIHSRKISIKLIYE